MAAITAGFQFEKAMRPILEGAGPLPHGRLQLIVGASSNSSRRKKRHSGQFKCACSTRGSSVHTAPRWLDPAGALCPKHDQIDVGKTPSRTTRSKASPHQGAQSVSRRSAQRQFCCRLTSNRSADAFTFATPVLDVERRSEVDSRNLFSVEVSLPHIVAILILQNS